MSKYTNKEVWKDIPNYPTYQVSSLGRIKSLGGKSNHKKDIIMKLSNSTKKYEIVSIIDKYKKRHTCPVHRLVAIVFIPNINNKPQINHINGDKNDNKIENLEWCTNSENQLHANKMGFCKNRLKASIEASRKPVRQYDKNNNFIREFYSARCAEEFTGVSYKLISLAANNTIKTGGGYIWKFGEKKKQ